MGNCNNNNKTSNRKSIEITLNAIEHVSTYNDERLNRNRIYYKRDIKSPINYMGSKKPEAPVLLDF